MAPSARPCTSRRRQASRTGTSTAAPPPFSVALDPTTTTGVGGEVGSDVGGEEGGEVGGDHIPFA